jgi:hypothetical protein
VRLSEIQVYLLWELHLVALDPLSWLRIAYYSWVFPDILDGLEQRWCWARDWRLFRASPSDCEGFLSLLRGSSWIGYSSRAREGPHLMSGCATPTEGLTLDSQLAHDLSSGCITTTRTSLSGCKWTSIKILVSSLCWGFHFVYVIALIDWFIGHISTYQHRYNNPSPLLCLLIYLTSCVTCYSLSLSCVVLFLFRSRVSCWCG